MAQGSRHGRMKDGWSKQATQIPKWMADDFRDVAAEHGAGGVKVLSTIAMALVNEMPKEYRQALYRYVIQKTAIRPEDLQAGSVYGFLKNMIVEDHKASAGQAADKGATWYIDKILDPEVTLPPGRKPSDQAGNPKKRGTA